MRTHQKSMFVLAMITTLMTTGLFLPGLVSAGELEPSGPPDSTMKTLDEIPPTWSQILPASERFELVMGDKAVLDKETGLVWSRDANLPGGPTGWLEAMDYCRQNVNIAGRRGWRLPTVEELATLLDTAQTDPALPSGHPFVNVQSSYYWSSTTYDDARDAWHVGVGNGAVSYDRKYKSSYVWPVRGGK